MLWNRKEDMLFHNSPRVGVSGSTPVDGEEVDKPIVLLGRFMRADRSEHPCRARDITTETVRICTEAEVEEGERIIAYLDEIGRLEGVVEEIDENGFLLRLTLCQLGREKLQKKLEWLRSKARGEAREKRRYERFQPKDSRSCLMLEDGRKYPCEVLDISVAGASVKADVLPAIGTLVQLGKTRGRVVRHHAHGFAIEFVRLMPMEQLQRQIA